ncbi:MAG: hypothetical protein WD872_02300 [Pirellulaceae bacterium]
MTSAEPLHSQDQSLAAYSAVSRLAVLCLFLGLASALILISPLLALVPLATAAVAVVALRRIGASDGQLTGRIPATIGLCLAALFFGWGAARQLSRQMAMAAQAQQVADGWLEVVREGRLREADQLMKTPYDRAPTPQAMDEYYQADMEATETMQSFFGSQPMLAYRKIGPQAQFHFDSAAGLRQDGFTDSVVLKYFYSGPESAAEIPLYITVARTTQSPSRRPGWYVQTARDSLPQ